MSQSSLDQWIIGFGPIFGQLVAAVTVVAESADHARRVVDQRRSYGTQLESLDEVGVAAANLLTVVTRAQGLPPIPEENTEYHFTSGLIYWADAAAAAGAAARRRDGAQVAVAAHAMAAGTEHFVRAAASLERAVNCQSRCPVR